jgi:hypothetical protein
MEPDGPVDPEVEAQVERLIDERLVPFERASESLRQALDAGGSSGRSAYASGIAPDGASYIATVWERGIFVEPYPFREGSLPVPEPAGIGWRPGLAAFEEAEGDL